MANEAIEKDLIVKYMIGENEIKLTPNIVKEYIVGDKDSKITNQEFKLFTESDLKIEEPNFEDVIEINESTGEVKSNKINLEDL